MKIFTTIALSMLLGLSTHASIIYQQPAVAGSGGYVSSSTTPGGSNLEEFVWDSFSTATTMTLREIQWSGVRTNAPVDFQISINTIALPGGKVWNTGGTASEAPTGIPGVYDYKFTLPAGFILTGSQGYWLQIIGLQAGWPEWQWSTGTGGNGTHTAQVPAVTGNYRFVNTGGDVAFTLLDQATAVVTVTLARSPAAGGTVTGGGTFAAGANVTISAAAATGRDFVNWTEAGVVVSSSASYTFAADGHKTLTANFSGPNTGPYMINAVANPGIYGNVGGAGTVNAGEIRELDVSAADGPSFVGWTEDGWPVDLPYVNGVYQVTASADRNLVANFAYTYATSFINGVVSPVSGGGISIGGGLSSGSYYGGTMITFQATPAYGYHFAYWKQGMGIGDVSGAPRIVGYDSTLPHMVCYATTITAYFEPDEPVLSLGSSPVAGGTNTGDGIYAHGSNVTVNATPAVGYAFSSWKQGNTVMSTSPSYTFPLTNHMTLAAVYDATDRIITASAAPVAGGSVTGGGVVGNGASVTLTASAAPGYTFSSWTLGGAPAGSSNPITFDATADFDFVANFIALPLIDLTPHAPSVFGFAWPESATGWILEESPDLSHGSWVPSTQPITTSGGQKQISIPNPTGRRFFRLAKP